MAGRFLLGLAMLVSLCYLVKRVNLFYTLNRWAHVPVTRTGFRPLHIYLSKHREVLARALGDDEYKPNKEIE
jgi:hypothetical protein